MSLSSHLNNPSSPIRQFLRTRFPNTRAITAPANARLRAAHCLRPDVETTSYPYALVGMAVDYRLRYIFGVTPPKEFVAWEGAQRLLRQLFFAPDLDSLPDPAAFDYQHEEIEAFFDSLASTTAALQPIERLFAPADDATLARYCFVLSLFEQVYRSGRPSEMLALPEERHSVADLLAIPNEVMIADICQIAHRFYSQFADLFAKPCNLNPIFTGSRDVGGADGDLIIDGCLLDIKTTKQSALDAEWIRQLIGYVLLDYDDVLAIRSVGLYLARQGEMFIWSVDEFLYILSSDETVTLASLRAEFRQICEGVQQRRQAI